MSSIPRAVSYLVCSMAALAVGCTETISVDATAGPDRGVDRLVLDPGAPPDASPHDAADVALDAAVDGTTDGGSDGSAADGSADAADGLNVDGAPDDGAE